MKSAVLFMLLIAVYFLPEDIHRLHAADRDFELNNIKTGLYKACEAGDIVLVRKLLSSGANINIRNKRANPSGEWMSAEEDETPLYAAVRCGNYDLVKLLIDNGASVRVSAMRSGTPLHVAVTRMNPEIVDLLLRKGADPNLVFQGKRSVSNEYNGAPLHQVIMLYSEDTGKRYSLSKRGISYTAVPIVKSLADNGADVNIRYPGDGKTPLHMAVERGYFDIVKILVEHGADVNVLESATNDYTPLYYAMQRPYHNEIEKYLRNHGAVSSSSEATKNLEISRDDDRRSRKYTGAAVIGFSLLYAGASVYFYEEKYKNNRGGNTMGSVNAYAGTAALSGAIGYLLGYWITDEGSGIMKELRRVGGGFLGAAIAVPAGIMLARYSNIPHSAKYNRAVYYSAPAASCAVTILYFSINF